MTFSKKRYRELLEYSQSLRKKGKKLSDICESDFLELLTYSIALYKQLDWECRDSYVELMDQFLKGKICKGTLKIKFLKIQESQEQVQKALESNLIILSPNPNSDSVGDLISDLHWVLEDLSLDSTLSLEELESLIKENKHEEAEKKKELEIYNSVKKIYFKIQNFLNEE